MATDDLIQIISSGRWTSTEEEGFAEIRNRAFDVLIESQRKEIERQNEEIEDLKQDRGQRRIFSYCIFGFMCVYMATAVAIVFLCGLGRVTLDDSVVITLLSTALANVIGVFTFVAKYLFHYK